MKKLIVIACTLFISVFAKSQEADTTIIYHCKVIKESVFGNKKGTGSVVSKTVFSVREKGNQLFTLKIARYYVNGMLIPNFNSDILEVDLLKNDIVIFSCNPESHNTSFETGYNADVGTSTEDSIDSNGNDVKYENELFASDSYFGGGLKSIEVSIPKEYVYLPTKLFESIIKKYPHNIQTEESYEIDFVFDNNE